MFSPYAAMGNAPESMIDPNGEMPGDPSLHIRATGGSSSENSNRTSEGAFNNLLRRLMGDGSDNIGFRNGGSSGFGIGGSGGSSMAFWRDVVAVFNRTTTASTVNNQGDGSFAVNLNGGAGKGKTGDGAFDNTSEIPKGIASLQEVEVTKPYMIRVMENFRSLNASNGDRGKEVDPSTLGSNVFGTNYIGPWNPKDFGGNWNYDIAPVSKLDGHAKKRDLAYDDAHVAGIGGVLFSTKVINADYSLVYGAYNRTFNKNNVSIGERMQGLAVGTFIGLFVFPKSIYFMGQAAGQNEKSNKRSGNWIGNLDH